MTRCRACIRVGALLRHCGYDAVNNPRGRNSLVMSFILILIFVAIAASSAVAALTWAIKSGQFSNLSQGAATIFDDEMASPEPLDLFPKDNAGATPPEQRHEA